MLENTLNIDQFEVEKLKKGDIKSFNKLFNKYAERLYFFSLKYLKSVEEAEEVVQSVFLYIWENQERLKPEYSFKSYLFTIASNKIKKAFLKRAKENEFKDEFLCLAISQNSDTEDEVDYKSLLNKVNQVVESMPAKRKKAFILRKYQNLSIKEIAYEMDLSPNTIENHLSAAQKQIFAELKSANIEGLLFFSLFIEKNIAY